MAPEGTGDDTRAADLRCAGPELSRPVLITIQICS